MKKNFKIILFTTLIALMTSVFSSCLLFIPTEYDRPSKTTKGTVEIYNYNEDWNTYIDEVCYWNGSKWVSIYSGSARDFCSFTISSGYKDFRITELYPNYYGYGNDGVKYYYTKTHGDPYYGSKDYVYGTDFYVYSNSTLKIYFDGEKMWKRN